MFLAIFHFSSWDVIEPWTWIVQATWMVVAAGLYAVKQTDLNEVSMFNYLEEKKMREMIKAKGFDEGKKQFLEELISEIED